MEENNQSQDKKGKVVDQFINLKSNIESVIKEKQKDFAQLLNKDVGVMKKKLQKEKIVIEKTVSQIVNKELMKAKKFLDAQKKEINKLQAKLEKVVQAKKKAGTKKVAKKAAKKK